MKPPKVFCNTFLTKKKGKIEILGNCQWINNKSVDYIIKDCSWMREGEGSILGTSELKKLLKIDISVSLCDNAAHKRAGKQRIQWILKNYMLSVGKE